MRLPRAVALGALVAAALLVAVVFLGGDGGHVYDVRFENAGQLVPDDDVQVGGRRVGAIEEIRLTEDNHARIRIRVEEPYAPLREGTLARIRATSLSGVANRYISLAPGPNNAKVIPAGATIDADSSRGIVDLDQLFNTLDPPTRENLQKVVQGFAASVEGKAPEAAEAAEYFNPFLSTSRRLIGEVTEDEDALSAFIVNSSRAVTALADRRQELSELVGNANATARAIGEENVALAQALGILPTTLRRANTTFVNLRATLGDLDLLVRESKPATKDLARVLRELRPLVRDARPTIRDLRRLVTRGGPDNDLVDATRKLPGLQRVATPALISTREALIKSQPVLEFIRPYTPDVVGWLRDYGGNAATYDANGHYARIQPIFNAFSFTDNPAGGTLTPQSPSNRFSGLQNGFTRRCPGAASQPPADNSGPFTDGTSLDDKDCDPNQVLPGP